MYVLRVMTRADGVVDDHTGRFLQSFDPDQGTFIGGKGTMTTTLLPQDGLAFATPTDAMEFWATQHGIRPWDGQPSRPLTAYTVEVIPLEALTDEENAQ